MKPLAPVSLALLVVAVLLPSGALAKGASEATIRGPGLDGPLTLPGEGRPGGERLMTIAEQAGFFAAVFGQSPDAMLESRPNGDLGAKYTIVYRMPGPSNELDEIRQDVYPFAQPSPVMYTEPGQPFWSTERTRGGWFVGRSTLRDLLVAAGLPKSPPASADSSTSGWEGIGPFALVLIAAALAGLAAFAIRRRPRPA